MIIIIIIIIIMIMIIMIIYKRMSQVGGLSV